MEISSALKIIDEREKKLLFRLNEIKQRKLLQRDWREELVNKMEIIDIKEELSQIQRLKNLNT
jgi:hypothetical protein